MIAREYITAPIKQAPKFWGTPLRVENYFFSALSELGCGYTGPDNVLDSCLIKDLLISNLTCSGSACIPMRLFLY